jgi:hypothetical protein
MVHCIRDFLKFSPVEWRTLDNFLETGSSGQEARNGDERLQRNDEILAMVQPRIDQFVAHMGGDEWHVSLHPNFTPTLLTNLKGVENNVKQFHQDAKRNSASRLPTRNINIPLTTPLLHTRLSKDADTEEECWAQNQTKFRNEAGLTSRGSWTSCKNTQRGSATYFDSLHCHRGMNGIDLSGVGRVTLVFVIQISPKQLKGSVWDPSAISNQYGSNTPDPVSLLEYEHDKLEAWDRTFVTKLESTTRQSTSTNGASRYTDYAGGGAATKKWGIKRAALPAKWVSTGDKASVKAGRGKPASLKTVYRNTASGELRVRKMVARPDGNKRVSYVKF